MAKPSTSPMPAPKGDPFKLIPMEKMPRSKVEIEPQPVPQLPAVRPSKK